MIEKTTQALLTSGIFAMLTAPAFAETAGSPEWHYDGAEHWGDLAPEFAACALGQEQSPIDLTKDVLTDLEPVEIHWNAAAAWVVKHNGHTIQANTENGGSIKISGVDYTLAQFHFHTPSEHAVSGEKFPMEVHFVHAAADGTLAVLGVMMQEGESNALFHTVMEKAPQQEGAADYGFGDFSALLPTEGGMFRYQGSLTTPPCSEVVIWTVFKNPISVDAADVAAFKAIFQDNARPLQPTGRRFILSE